MDSYVLFVVAVVVVLVVGIPINIIKYSKIIKVYNYFIKIVLGFNNVFMFNHTAILYQMLSANYTDD